MTYWPREHQANLRRIGDMIRELDHAYEDLIPGLVSDLRDDDDAGTLESRDDLRRARSYLAQAMNHLRRAERDLPEPQVPPRFTQLHPTAEHVMEREG